MDLDKELQHKILIHLKEHPAPQPSRVWTKFEKSINDEEKLFLHLSYLEDHGLIKSGVARGLNGHHMVNSGIMSLTAKGRDFLEADGGLSAVFNTVTVKIHEESLDRIAEFLAAHAPNQRESSRMLAQLRSLPADATKHVLLKLVDLALEHAPQAALLLIRNTLGSG